MNPSPPKSLSVSSERKQTSIFLKPLQKPPSVSHLPIFSLTVNKENVDLQKQSWDSYLASLQLTTASQKKKLENFIELRSQTDSRVKFKFPLYTDKELGISLDIQQLLRESYENDDDINTRESVMDFFVDVCKKDLLQGIRENEQITDSEGNPITNFAGLQNRLREQYESIQSDVV